MTWADPQATHNPAAGVVIPSAWGDSVRNAIVANHGRPRCRVRRSTGQSIGSGDVTVLFDTDDVDTHSMHSVVSNTDRLTVPAGWSGDWIVGASIQWDPSALGTFRSMKLVINNAVALAEDTVAQTASGYCAHHMATLWFPSAGDFFTVQVKQDTGGNLDIVPTGYAGVTMWAIFGANGIG